MSEHPTYHAPQVFDLARAKRVIAELGPPLEPYLDRRDTLALIEGVAGNSPYLGGLMLKEPKTAAAFFEQGPDSLLGTLNADALGTAEEENPALAMRRLRLLKRRAALVIALADLSGLYDVDKVTAAMTRLADASVSGALRFLLREAVQRNQLAPKSGETLADEGGLIVIAMGKHGAFELNYSSDIDLVVFYDEERFPFYFRGEKRAAAVDLTQRLLRLLSEPTAEGYVFRVDLRLRPDAGATQIAISTEAAELYYESIGQNWERAAWIKARAVGGDRGASQRFLKWMEPFVWRKNLDYAAIEDIHSIKRQIHAHGGHASVAAAGHNIKLGRGGIREIEFFAQTQQLILGGRDPALRVPTTLGALKALQARGHISRDALDDLTASYRFLRALEHRLQMIDDQQTHTLPKTPDDMDHVARFMGYADTVAFEDTLLSHLTRVQGHYARLFEREAPLAGEKGSLVFTGVEEDPETVATLARMGFSSAADISAIVRGWHHGRIRATRSARARELLTKLMPALLSGLSKTADPHAAFVNFDRFLSGLPAGVQVFSMLIANPRLLELLAEIAGSAPKLAEYLGRHPSVLDALTDADFLSAMPSREELARRLDAALAAAMSHEAVLDAARRFAKEENFRVGVQVIEGMADAEHAGPAYARVAETAICGLQAAIEREMTAVHGRIAGGAFTTIALGKLGGREMTAASDLDLVFIYAHDKAALASDGKKPLPPATYYARASQRLISGLTAATAEGRLYDVDMRLRPSGNQGPVAVRLESFIDYHRERSWTWERMALTRARVLSGAPQFRAAVERAITDALTRSENAGTIFADARAMRDKLSLQFPGRGIWDIKFVRGGLIDIEFIAQTLQLVHAPKDPSVLDQNTLGALEKLARAGFLSSSDAEVLITAARLEHGLTQVLRIAVDRPFDPETASRGLRALLARDADTPDFAVLARELEETEGRVHAIFERLLPSP
ncbi:MAG TPA: bifunctional [glutamine synthetase] adenylyltransferase/[glutamine synthetase]-adenylyl-L-tyrosine phosphorylase [Micropepsaceae bacterium]|nr:bifunctional [glutamine synthetase] adenylyltransferase/[glutamine synthetase]-adenylyl-L-tyrosine phosphorylase [Micropepsaceae bacterium]